jgi:hypothetical protein
MGFYTTITFVVNIFERARMQILGQVMDINYLTWNLNLALAKQTHLAHFFHPPTFHIHVLHLHLGQPCRCKGGGDVVTT